MTELSPQLQQLINSLRILPGVGVKTAQRMAFELLKQPMRTKALALARDLTQSMENITNCQQCRNFTESELCSICTNPSRQNNKLCVVQSPIDLLAVEKSHDFYGHYFVLMGNLSPIDGIGPKELGLDLLKQRLQTGLYQEVILATNATVEGEATAFFIYEMAKPLGITVSRIAYGIPVGGELEYLGEDTLSQALKSRREM